MLGAGELCIAVHSCSANWGQRWEGRLFSLGERIFALDSGRVRYKQGNAVYFIEFIDLQP